MELPPLPPLPTLSSLGNDGWRGARRGDTVVAVLVGDVTRDADDRASRTPPHALPDAWDVVALLGLEPHAPNTSPAVWPAPVARASRDVFTRGVGAAWSTCPVRLLAADGAARSRASRAACTARLTAASVSPSSDTDTSPPFAAAASLAALAVSLAVSRRRAALEDTGGAAVAVDAPRWAFACTRALLRVEGVVPATLPACTVAPAACSAAPAASLLACVCCSVLLLPRLRRARNTASETLAAANSACPTPRSMAATWGWSGWWHEGRGRQRPASHMPRPSLTAPVHMRTFPGV